MIASDQEQTCDPVENEAALPTRGRVWLLAFATWGLIALSVLLPIVGHLGGIDWLTWGWVLTPLVGLLVAGAVWLSRRRGDGGIDRRLLDFLAIMFAPVRQIRDDLAHDAEVVRGNAELVANMSGVLGAFGLGGLDADTTARLGRNARLGSRPERHTVPTLAVEVAEVVADDPAYDIPDNAPNDTGTLGDCLAVLYADRHGLPCELPARPEDDGMADSSAESQHRNAEQRKEDLVLLLTALVARHDLVAGASEQFERGEIQSAIRRIEPFSLDELITRLRQAPSVVVKNMVELVELFDLGTVPPEKIPEIAQDLSGKPYVELAQAAAHAVTVRFENAPTDEEKIAAKARLLELLYRDRFGRSTIRLWSSHKAELISGLAPYLAKLKRFSDADVPLGSGDLEKILARLDDFDMTVVEEVVIRLGRLWDLASGFDAYAAANDSASPEANDTASREVARGSLTVSQFLGIVDKALPVSRAELFRLESSRLAVDLVMKLGREWVSQWNPTSPQGERNALELVTAGAFLARAGSRLDATVHLARRASRSDECVHVAEILLTRMWRHQESIEDGGVGSVALAELGQNWKQWLEEAQSDDALGSKLAARLIDCIQDELTHGEWPTRFPMEAALIQLTDKVDELAGAARERAATVEQQEELTEALQELAVIGDRSTGAVRERSERLAVLTPEEPEFEAVLQAIRLEVQDEYRAAAEESATDPIEQLLGQVEVIAQTEHELANAVNRLLAERPESAGMYVITFDSASGRLADDLDTLTARDDAYEFVHYTPYARFGHLPVGTTAADFSADFAHDVTNVLEGRSLVPLSGAVTDDDVGEVDITLQLIAKPMRWKIERDQDQRRLVPGTH